MMIGTVTIIMQVYSLERPSPPGGRWRGPRWAVSSDLAIETSLILRAVFHQPLRQTEGLVGSLLELMGLDLPVPDHTTLSRRAGTLAIALQAASGPVHMLVDSTGVKLSGVAGREAWHQAAPRLAQAASRC
jgi:hypothetical protein